MPPVGPVIDALLLPTLHRAQTRLTPSPTNALAMSSRRLPLTVYSAKRRQRSISNPHSRPVPSSSPLKPLAHDADITVEEMSRRMMKRSRNSLKRSHSGPGPLKSASTGASPVDRPLEEVRPAKRSKPSTREPLRTIMEPIHMYVDEEGTADMDLTDVALLKTPVPRDGAVQHKQDDTAMNEESDFLSPLPTSRTSKRVVAHRTSSSNLTENKEKKLAPSTNYMLMSPASNDLASPFHSRPGSPNATRSAAKKALNKKLNRTRSVGTDLRRRATMRSFSRAVSPASNASSPGTRRHPSLPSSQGTQKENQDWLVPAQFKQSISQVTPRRPSETSVPFVRESSFFNSVPEACSTPVHTKRASTIIPPTPGRDIDATPRMPLVMRSSVALSHSKDQNISMLDEPTPRARTTTSVASSLPRMDDSLFPDSMAGPGGSPSQAFSMPPAPLNARRRMTVHLSQDSIFSSALDFSTSVAEKRPISNTLGVSDKTRVQSESLTLAPPSSPVAAPMSPASSDGDELRDMFSILGLDEDDQWFTSSIAGTDPPRPTGSSVPAGSRTKKTKSTTSTRKSNSKQELISAKVRASCAGGQALASSISQAPVRRKRVLIIADSPPTREPAKKPATKQYKPRPTIKMRILDKPIQVTSDSSDELNFLKSRVGQNSSSSDS